MSGLLLLLLLLGSSHGCLDDPTSAYRFTGAVCRLTYPAAVVLNEKTTNVIETAFEHTRYPSVKGEKTLLFGSKLIYGLDNLEIYNLSIGRSSFQLLPGEGIAMEISNVSAAFKGTIQYGYDSRLVNFGHSVDFEIESQIDLGINPKLYCGEGKVAADTSDCYLNFHKLQLLLQGDREPPPPPLATTSKVDGDPAATSGYNTIGAGASVAGPSYSTSSEELAGSSSVIPGEASSDNSRGEEQTSSSNESQELLQDIRPNWLKKLFTNFITFTVKLVIKGQICKEINKVANILADFIQERAEHFLTDGDISVNIGITAPPVITANYIESYHKGWTNYQNTSAVINESVFNPQQLTEHKMLYFWVSDEMLNPIVTAAHQDGRFQLNISGAELTKLFQTHLSNNIPEFLQKCLLDSPELTVWSSSIPSLNTSCLGTTVTAQASGKLYCGNSLTPTLYFQMDLTTAVTVSYEHKKVILHSNTTQIFGVTTGGEAGQYQTFSPEHQALVAFITECVENIGIPTVLSVLSSEITRLLDKQGTYLFDIYQPQVIPQQGYVLIQMDFGFPHHLLVQFLQRTLQ